MIVLPIIPTSAIQRLKGSALGDGIACMIRKNTLSEKNKGLVPVSHELHGPRAILAAKA